MQKLIELKLLQEELFHLVLLQLKRWNGHFDNKINLKQQNFTSNLPQSILKEPDAYYHDDSIER